MMSSLETLVVALLAVWLGAISVAVLLVIRQISLLTVRLGYVSPHTVTDDHGPAIGSAVPAQASELLGLNGEGRAVVFLSSTCGPCRDFATGASPNHLGDDTSVLISGREELALGVAALLPSGTEPLLDPTSREIAAALGVEMVPFALYISDGRIRGKSYLRDPDELVKLRALDGDGAVRLDFSE
jgi:hypothetical protein